ncbi:serine hydrolase [Streptomyces sp. HNM0574]|uniref:serine hydrolase n=1 Tax=Streptomyces sp. HNM0574 TaxID=2714954 RepID=UPI00146B25A2|nr:serine hydrolase [Streptomyces sp. HNM0574]NLU67424.1 serine hydrolase [Streptomyces sp. HNM0574]
MLSVYAGPLNGDGDTSAHRVWQRHPDHPYYAASTMKVTVLAALHRSPYVPDRQVELRNEFTSAVPSPPYAIPADLAAEDPGTWRMLGRPVTLRWLARRMIGHSSDLATNALLELLGCAAAQEIWRLAGARHSTVRRGIEDAAAREAGVTNLVTAADLARLLRWLPAELLGPLAANVHRVDLAAGLPPGTRIAFKNGWVTGIRHSAGIVFPHDAPPYVLSVCYAGPLANGRATGDPAARLLARISARAWAHRHALAAPR